MVYNIKGLDWNELRMFIESLGRNPEKLVNYKFTSMFDNKVYLDCVADYSLIVILKNANYLVVCNGIGIVYSTDTICFKSGKFIEIKKTYLAF